MKGLLIKDIYMTAKHCKAYLVIVVAFMALSCAAGEEGMFFLVYLSALCGMIPVNLISFDDHYKWSSYAGALPVTKTQIVSGKYIIGLGCQAVLLVLTTLVQGIVMAVRGGIELGELLVLLITMLSVGMFSMAVSMPFLFKLGVEKGRIVYIVAIGALAGIGSIIGSVFGDLAEQEIRLGGGFALVPVAAIVLFALSWLLSVRFYEKREVV